MQRIIYIVGSEIDSPEDGCKKTASFVQTTGPLSHVIPIRNYMSHPFNPTHYTCDLMLFVNLLYSPFK